MKRYPSREIKESIKKKNKDKGEKVPFLSFCLSCVKKFQRRCVCHKMIILLAFFCYYSNSSSQCERKAKSSQSHIFFYFKGERGFSEKVRKTPFILAMS